MKRPPLKKVDPITVFVCGGKSCPKGGDHQWDAEVEEKYEGGGGMWSQACSKCGLSRMDYDLMTGDE